MQIRALFFASYRDLVGLRELSLQVGEGSTVAEVLAQLRDRGDPFSRLPLCPAVAVNEEYAELERPLADGDVVALIPPVAGG